ncbi:MAG: RMD1 family protein [Desulfurococcales archaeon]|nr:RMD1 family protein [Desulfurococcales archaeon]
MVKEGPKRIIALALGREFDPESVRNIFGRTFPRWDEPLVLTLKSGAELYVFAFGVVVFIGYTGSGEEKSIIDRLKRAAEAPAPEPYTEEYLWNPSEQPRGRGYRVNMPNGLITIRDEAIYGPLDEETKRILALVIAQSSALKRLEAEADSLLEEIESILDRLLLRRLPLAWGVRGSLLRVLRARNTLVGDLLILEKPKAAWEDIRYEKVLEGLRYVFEIEERYVALNRKLSSALETIEVIAAFINEARFLLLETLIVLFFIIDILLALK